MPMRRRILLALCDRLDDAIGRLATAAATLIVMIAAIQIAVSMLRTFYSYAPLTLQELIPNLNVVLVSVSICYGVLRDVHTRVDILTEGLRRETRVRFELVLVVALLWPSAFFLAFAVAPYVIQSWASLEGSRNVGGLGGTYIIKSFLLVMSAVLALQAVSIVVRILLLRRWPYLNASPEPAEA
jgi:TRAP-type mannitol/chloroaromatic compound transport system permease small subunit